VKSVTEAPRLNSTLRNQNSIKKSTDNSIFSIHISAYFFYRYYFSGPAFADIMLGVSMAEANMSRVL